MTNLQLARLVSLVTSFTNRSLDSYELDQLLACLPTEAEKSDVSFEVRNLMNSMANNRKIDAIKAFRALTNDGLKESKEFVESVMHSISVHQ